MVNEATTVVPSRRPPKPFGGLPWCPELQFAAFELKGPEIWISGDDRSTQFLPANPSRVAWFAQATADTIGYAISPVPYDPLTISNLFDSYARIRCHAAEWPLLCQGEWWISAVGDGAKANAAYLIWEVVGIPSQSGAL